MSRKLFLPLLLLATFASASTAPTQEEQTVRTYYAKLAYAARTGVLVSNVLASQSNQPNHLTDSAALQKEMNAQLAFTFNDFKVGNLADIASMRWDSLVTKPSQDLVGIGFSSLPFRIGPSVTQMNYATANWQRTEQFDGDWSTPVKQIIAELPKDNPTHPDIAYSRYASYEVTVKLEGRQRSYKATFLFGKNPDGSAVIFPIDHVLGMGALNFFNEQSIYPQPLLETYLREMPGVREWIASAGINSNSTARDVICDWHGQCGIPVKVLRKSLDTPIDPASRQFILNPNSKNAPTITCASYNASFTAFPVVSGITDHVVGGSHTITDSALESCVYTSTGGLNANCSTTCSVNQTPGSALIDTGATESKSCHVLGMGWANGLSTGYNLGASCAGTMTGGATQCASASCNCTITVNMGLITATGTVILNEKSSPSVTCAAEPDPNYCAGGQGSKHPGTCCTGVNCHCCTCAGGTGCASPIVVDTTGEGFHLTSAEAGVVFDIRGDGKPVQLAWTAAGSGNAWLALDRNHNGVIDSGKELFGNYTAQPKCSQPNGFLALDQFDLPANGGNGDGVIDKRDKVYADLRLWIDANHNGISEPGELHTLEEMGVYSLALHYNEAKQIDSYGNTFRYKAKVNPEGEPRKDRVDRWTYDVWLVTMEDVQHGKFPVGKTEVIRAQR